jgi:PII-like signaling protein
MRVLEGEQRMVRIFVGEDDRWEGQLLHIALLERFRKEGIAGATVFRGISGYGARSIVHSTHLLRMSEDLPLVIEVVDAPEHIERMLPIIETMVSEGLVTVETVRVIKYAPGPPPAKP